MNSDDYFDDELDSAFLHEVDTIEAAYLSAPSRQQSTPHSIIELSDSDDFDSFHIDESALQQIDQICRDQLSGAAPTAGPSKRTLSRTTSKGAQLTLFGDVLEDKPALPRTNSSKQLLGRTSSGSRNAFGGREKKTKQWNHTEFAKSGWKKPKSAKGKDKAQSFDDNEDELEEEPVEFVQYPAPFVSIGPTPPMKLLPDRLAARRWIYPLNQPKRDYQFNIVKNCLFENTLVALPTGLGKTFIAGVVMLNYYNWFPTGKVVFMAPTRPLVAQQIDACHKTCGIPGSHAAELTGNNPKASRAKYWQEKRVFYMTPQCLINDLTSSNIDPTDIVLLVIDEAHKGSGDYAYAQVIRFLMAKNPHFRVLALTATPGSTPEAVQAIVDALHISHIEIRHEESLDLASYMHKKKLEQHIVKMNDDIIKIRDLLVKIMDPIIKQLQNANVMRGYVDPITLHPFRCTAAMKEVRSNRGPSQPWVFSSLSKLGILARVMGYLVEASVRMCYTALIDPQVGDESTSNKQTTTKGKTALQKDANYRVIIKELEAQKSLGFPDHPKMEKLRFLLIQHFGSIMVNNENPANGVRNDSRVMVFVSFRECVDEVVEMLNKESPLIRAMRFVGQSADKQGNKGFAQKEQMEVINKFKKGEFNVLVSTSIGEEGLDIGEIDMIICYDAQKTPIRMLQRIGRTGRKRDGIVHVLLAEGREESNWSKAQDKYEEVQHYIVRADQVELYGDVERLLPDTIHPECVEMTMDIEEYGRPDFSYLNKMGDVPKGQKRKRDDNLLRNIPAGALTGFASVKDLIVKNGATKKKQNEVEFDEHLGEDDEDDLAIEAGLHGPRRTVSSSGASKPAPKKKLKRAATVAGNIKKAKKPSRKKKVKDLEDLTGSQLEEMGQEDSDDLAIERGLDIWTTPPRKLRSPPRKPDSSPEIPLADNVIDLTTPDVHSRASPFRLSSSPEQPDIFSRASPFILSSSPGRPLEMASTSTSVSASSGGRDSGVTSAHPPEQSASGSSHGIPSETHSGDVSMAWLIEDDEDPDIEVIGSSPRSHHSFDSLDVHIHEESEINATSHYIPTSEWSPAASPIIERDISAATKPSLHDGMPPPALPDRLSLDAPSFSDESYPQSTFAVRAPGRRIQKRKLVEDGDSSPLAMPPPSQRRLQRVRDDSSPPPIPPAAKSKKRKFKDIAEAQQHNPWLDVEASHSGDEVTADSSDTEPLASEGDNQFVEELPETQVSPSYDQSAVYRRSLFTQAPGTPSKVPAFANRPVRRGRRSFALAGPSARRRPVLLSSPPREDEPDEYVFGSFVVDDDAEISYNTSSET